MTYTATSLILFAVCHGQHARADFKDATQIGKTVPKAFAPIAHMPRLSGLMLVNRADAVAQANSDAAPTFRFPVHEAPSSNQFDSALRMQETPITKQSEELKELVQHLRARVQPIPQADAKDAQYRFCFGILTLLMVSVGLVVSIGIAVIQQYFARVQQALESSMGSQISTPQQGTLRFRGWFWQTRHDRCPKPSLSAVASSSSPSPIVGSKSSAEDEEDESTVVSISNPKTGQSVTLVGTAHLSGKSSQQVQRVIETLQPKAVMIEMDRSRFKKMGFDSAGEIRVARVTDSEDIKLPMSASQTMDKGIVGMLQKAFAGAFSQAARLLLSQLYKTLGKELNTEAGGEFRQAIRSAEDCTVCDTVILGDRNAVTTIERFADLAIESGDFFGVLGQLLGCADETMSELKLKVRKELLQQKGEDGNDTYKLDEAEFETAMMEAMKEEPRLFSKLEQDVPQFTQAFIKERDYVMSESIRRELERPEVKTVVGVVGCGHLPGMERHFKTVFADAPAPLEQELAAAATK